MLDVICVCLALFSAPTLVLYMLSEKDKKEQAIRREKFLNTPVDVHKCVVRIYTYDGALFTREFIGEISKKYNYVDVYGEYLAKKELFSVKDFVEIAENRFFNVGRIKLIEWDVLPHYITPKDVL